MKTDTQLLADMYAAQGGREQLLVAVYADAFVLYTNVSDDTAVRIGTALGDLKGFTRVAPAARSADGMTYCWAFGFGGKEHLKWPEHPGHVMVPVAAALRRAAPMLLPESKAVSYVDNRTRDCDTLQSFCRYLREKQ